VPGQRNRLASLLSAPYFLQLDDDSFPVRGDLGEAASWLEANPDALALAFVVNSGEKQTSELAGLHAAPFRCHFFIGCASLIKRELFLELGRYEESFEYNCEEIELALRAQLKNLFVYQYPAVVVRHNRSPLARNQKRRFSLLIRNELLVAGLHYPFVFLLIRWPVFLLKALLFQWATPGEIAGGISGAIGMYPGIWPRREVVPLQSFLAWKRLPSPIEFK
jgi:GT2 family glycosyltransferase